MGKVDYAISGCVESHIGLVRQNNEDNFLLNYDLNTTSSSQYKVKMEYVDSGQNWICVGVFDGIGGASKGEKASLIAAEELRKQFERIDGMNDLSEIEKVMEEGFLNANRRVIEEIYAYVSGTTATLLVSNGIVFKVFHIGDSRAYLMRDNNLFQLTKDQTLAELKLAAGLYEREDEIAESDKHQLTEYIGCDNSLVNLRPEESEWIDFRVKDKILLCTDGVYDSCENSSIQHILQKYQTPEEITQQLIVHSLEAGGEDNSTCAIVMKSQNSIVDTEES